MIKKNDFELEYVTMLDTSTYLTLDQWLLSGGTEVEFYWMNVDQDEYVSWIEFLNAKIQLINFNNEMVDGLYTSQNLNSDRYGNIDDTNDQYYFYDRDNNGYINETEYISALMDEIVFQLYLDVSEQSEEIPV